MLISDLGLIEPVSRHRCSPRDDGSIVEECGSVIPGGRQVGFTGVGVCNGRRDISVVITDDFTVWPEVMLTPFDAEPGPLRFRAARLAQQPDKPGALRKGTLLIARRADLGTVFLNRRGSK